MADDFDIPAAFDPFYTDEVALCNAQGDASGMRVNVTCRACVFDGGADEPLSDTDMESDIRRITVHIPASRGNAGGWPYKFPPFAGLELRIIGEPVFPAAETAAVFAVRSVSLFGSAYVLEAREK